MKTQNTNRWKWTQRFVATFVVSMLMASLTGQASARILFQDDDFHDIVSEGIMLNSDDGGDEDVTLQFGNDGTDATIIFDDGTGNVTLSTDGGDFSFSDDNITTTGDLSSTDITATGVINFASATRMALPQGATNPGTCTEGDLFYNTTDNTIYSCTASNTWTALSSGNQDFESVYSADADNTLTASGTFDIDATGALGIDSDSTVTVGGAGVSVTSDGGIVALTGDGTNDIDISNAGATIDMDASNVDISTSTWDITSAGVASGFTGLTSTGTVNFSGAGGFRIREDSDPATNAACATVGEIILDTTDNEIQVCTATGGAGAATWTTVSAGDADTLDGLDSLQFLRSDTSDAYTSGTLTFNAGTTLQVDGTLDADGVVNIGDNGDNVTIDSSTWDITGAGAASGFTTIDASGNITTSGGDFVIGTTGLTETNGAGDNGATLIGVDQTEFDNSSSTNVQDVLDDFDSFVGSNAPNVDELTFEPEYPDAVIYQDGTNNKGKLVSEYDSTNLRQYYRWDTKKKTAQDIDIRFRHELPADFDDAGNLTVRYRTNTTNSADNSVAVTVRNDTDNTTCHADPAAAGAAANTWGTLTITGAEIDTGCSGASLLAANDIIEVIMKLASDDTNSGFADVGELVFDYTN
ncbi:hypothetical protein GF366_03465 [Candidatus Peregrinibacteria bacterium]|nr:hypothetical protein [Candidatus Peregrinibacteria bacterium]